METETEKMVVEAPVTSSFVLHVMNYFTLPTRMKRFIDSLIVRFISPRFAVTIRNTSLLEVLRDNGIELDCKDDKGNSLIHHASKNGRSEKVIEWLLENGASLEDRNDNESTPLYLACCNGRIDVAKWLYEQCGCPLTLNKFLNSNLHMAAYNGHLHIVKWLLTINEHGLHSKNSYGATPFFMAAKGRRYAVMKYLLGQGANIDEADDLQYTPLLWACRFGYLWLTKFLLNNGANIDAVSNFGDTCFLLACKNGRFNLVWYLLKYRGCSINQYNKNGVSAINLAIWGGSLCTSQLLYWYGASLTEKVKPSSYTPLLWASSNGKVSTIKWLISRGASVHEMNTNNCTCLIIATKGGHFDAVKCLIANGASLEDKDCRKTNCLHFAAQKGHLELVKYFVAAGVPILYADSLNSTALSYAACGGHLDVVKWLLENGSTINDGAQVTVFLNACISGNIELVKYLLSYGASIDETAFGNRNCLYYACANNHVKLLDWLLTEHNVKLRKSDEYFLAIGSDYIEIVEYLYENYFFDEMPINKDGNTPLLHAGKYNAMKVMEYLLFHGSSVDETNNKGESIYTINSSEDYQSSLFLLFDNKRGKRAARVR